VVGLSELAGGDSVSLLFKVAEGADRGRSAAWRWAALCDNY
jgi:hypothetical protein